MRIGCAMWAHRQWPGRHLPRAGSELSAYGTWCTTVEGNTTFYATPSEATVRRWASEAAETMQFCFKLPRTITHERRLRSAERELDEFLARMEPLEHRLGPFQIQLPASFGPSDLDALAAFVTKIPGRFDWAVEVRHPAFFAGGSHERELDALLTSHGVNRVILDSRALFAAPPETPEEVEAWERKPRLAVRPIATSRRPLVRLIGQADPEASIAIWSKWIPKLASWVGDGLEPHVFVHTPDNVDALPLARRFHHLVADEVAADGGELPSLPEPERGDEQLGLWS
jgi:uncharacterized protein YecE (DUF72 family)